MPFGLHKDKELEHLPCSYLRWIQRDVKVEPPGYVLPENREEWRRTRTLLKYEVNRILRERGQNGVRVLTDEEKQRNRQRKGGRRHG